MLGFCRRSFVWADIQYKEVLHSVFSVINGVRKKYLHFHQTIIEKKLQLEENSENH